MKFRRAFTILELLVVISIMTILGVAAAASYGALVWGMKDRGACAIATSALRSAAERAGVERTRVVVYCYNKCTKAAVGEESPAEVMGCLTAIRVHSRITYRQGNFLYDEYGDLDKNYEYGLVDANNAAKIKAYTETDLQNMQGHRLFRYAGGKSSAREYSIVANSVYLDKEDLVLKTFFGLGDTNVVAGAFYDLGTGSIKASQWKVGDGYAFEFINAQLPTGYIFGNKVPSLTAGAEEDVKVLVFDPNGDTSEETVEVYRTKNDAQGRPRAGKKAGEASSDATAAI